MIILQVDVLGALIVELESETPVPSDRDRVRPLPLSAQRVELVAREIRLLRTTAIEDEIGEQAAGFYRVSRYL